MFGLEERQRSNFRPADGAEQRHQLPWGPVSKKGPGLPDTATVAKAPGPLIATEDRTALKGSVGKAKPTALPRACQSLSLPWAT